MDDKVRKLCKGLLTDKKVGAILGIKEENGYHAPYLFTEPADIDKLAVDFKYPLLYTCRPEKRNTLAIIQKKYPDAKIAIVARGCDERALIELAKRSQINLENVEVIGYACDKKQAEECECPTPYPNKLSFGEKIDGVSEDKELEKLMKMSLDKRKEFWEYQFSKCIKCYGCRNFCPVCICKDCQMEQEYYAKTGWLPPDFPNFHIVQRYHHAAQCIECAECGFTCPMDIPLRLISKQLRKRVKDLFDYEPGLDVNQESPIITLSVELQEES